MATFTIKIDYRNKLAKSFIEFITNFAEVNNFVEIERIDDDFKTGLQKAGKEIALARKGKKKLNDAKSFLNGL